MTLFVLYCVARGTAFACVVYCTFDGIYVATSDDLKAIDRRGMTWRLSGALWGAWLAWGQLETAAMGTLL